jgi:hypothetical protein
MGSGLEQIFRDYRGRVGNRLCHTQCVGSMVSIYRGFHFICLIVLYIFIEYSIE